MEALEEKHDFGGRTTGMEETVDFAKKKTTITESFYNVNIFSLAAEKMHCNGNMQQTKHIELQKKYNNQPLCGGKHS